VTYTSHSEFAPTPTPKNSTNDYHFDTVIIKSISSALYLVMFFLYISHTKMGGTFDICRSAVHFPPKVLLWRNHSNYGWTTEEMGLRPSQRKRDYLLFQVFEPFCGPPASYLVYFVGIRRSSAGNKAADAWCLLLSSIWHRSSKYTQLQFHYPWCLHGMNRKNILYSVLYITLAMRRICSLSNNSIVNNCLLMY
jgi:hypothetical protein